MEYMNVSLSANEDYENVLLPLILFHSECNITFTEKGKYPATVKCTLPDFWL